MRRRKDKGLDPIDRLERRVQELETELRRRVTVLPPGSPGWQQQSDVEEDDDAPVSHAWLSILEPPVRRRPRVPRLPFEVLFLAGCAVAAGIADLEPLWIAAVMGAAWLLVSITEWSATLADRRRTEQSAAPPPRLVPVTRAQPDRAWYIPPVEQTMTDGMFASLPAGPADAPAGPVTEATAITRLPVAGPDAVDLESTIEHRAADTQA